VYRGYEGEERGKRGEYIPDINANRVRVLPCGSVRLGGINKLGEG
jgi:hypothetical protein